MHPDPIRRRLPRQQGRGARSSSDSRAYNVSASGGRRATLHEGVLSHDVETGRSARASDDLNSPLTAEGKTRACSNRWDLAVAQLLARRSYLRQGKSSRHPEQFRGSQRSRRLTAEATTEATTGMPARSTKSRPTRGM